MKIGKRVFDLKNHTYVMGILNVTPDSFSDGGLFINSEAAFKRAVQMVNDGADIIDVGGESTRPGYTPVSAEVQIERVMPVIELIKEKLDVPVSIDTYNAEVAKEAIKAGCDMVNDIWALQNTEEMAKLLIDNDVVAVLMHNRKNPDYAEFRKEVLSDLGGYLERATAEGISKDRIILDPGIGFGKTYEQNLSIIHHIDDLKDLGCPILMGTSRKSVIGLTLDLPIFERVEGTIATTVVACMKGVNFVRVHDVRENVRAIRMTEAILRT
ncbi:MAG: dihydropteroate synthase [Lachnospiraceae bacterium]|nr:dihydropteroate synthase [Lachnospiraceae bacterium]